MRKAWPAHEVASRVNASCLCKYDRGEDQRKVIIKLSTLLGRLDKGCSDVAFIESSMLIIKLSADLKRFDYSPTLNMAARPGSSAYYLHGFIN
jgi:hypothetical protein